MSDMQLSRLLAPGMAERSIQRPAAPEWVAEVDGRARAAGESEERRDRAAAWAGVYQGELRMALAREEYLAREVARLREELAARREEMEL